MPDALRFLVDTNILLRVSRPNDPNYRLIETSLKELEKQSSQLCFALQNVAEFWNVCTRPMEHNGYGLSLEETRRRVESIERSMTFLPDNEHVYSIWRALVIDQKVSGVQVHDAHIAATMIAHSVSRILTLNPGDFQRYSGLQVIHPNQIVE
jgi:predicted nucleic acid-binding protein